MGFGIPIDFLEGERCAQKVLGEALSALGVARGDGFFTGVDAKTAVFQGEEFCDFLCADKFCDAQSVEEAMAEEFGYGGEGFLGHRKALFIKEAIGGEEVEVGMKDEGIAEGMNGSSSGDATRGMPSRVRKASSRNSVAVWKRRRCLRLRKMPRSIFGKVNWR